MPVYKINTGLDCMIWYANEMESLAQIIHSKLTNVAPMNVQVSFKDASTDCYSCLKQFSPQISILEIIRTF